MLDNTEQQTLDFIQYSSIFGELDSNSGERSEEKSTFETPPPSGSGGNAVQDKASNK